MLHVTYTDLQDRKQIGRLTFLEKDKNASIFNFGSTSIDTDYKMEQIFEAPYTDIKSSVMPNFIGKIIDFFDKDTKDGEINFSKQGQTGDCYLLSAMNALSYTEEGRKIIEESLEYRDGYTLVHLKGCGTVKVDDSDVIRTKGSVQYCSGDDDMIIFELAVQKVIDDVLNNESVCIKQVDMSYWEEVQHKTSWLSPSIGSGGRSGWVMNYFVGKDYKTVFTTDDMKDALLRFEQNNNQDLAIVADINKTKKVKDVNGKKVKLVGPHAYSVKEVKDGVVTIINPWDSSKEIKLDIDVVCNNFDDFDILDLSENNPDKQFVSRKYKLDDDGNKIFIFDNPYREVKLEVDPETNKRIGIEDRIFDSETGKLSKIRLIKYDLKTGNKTLEQTIDCNSETGLPDWAN